MLLLIYRALWWLFLPFIVLYRFYRDASSPKILSRFLERFGFSRKNKGRQDIIIHAVSLGEVRAVTPVVEQLLQTYPSIRILFTSTTLTGSEQIVRTFEDRVSHCFLPLDIGFFVGRFLRKYQPKVVLIMETEIWPNLFNEAKKQNIPLYVVSACLSQKSFQSYKKIPKSIKFLLKETHVMAQTEDDAKRFLEIGAPHVSVMGNIKYAISLCRDHQQNSDALCKSKQNKLLWVLASSHEGEELLVIKAYKALREEIPNLILAIAPRHPERFNSVSMLLQEHQLSFVRRSKTDYEEFPVDSVWLFDSIGELLFLYAAADIVTVGGSFVPVGGHNILEPAFLGKPIVVGPYIEEIINVTQSFNEHQAIVLSDEEHLYNDIKNLCINPSYRHVLGDNAKSCVANNQKALSILFDEIQQYLI